MTDSDSDLEVLAEVPARLSSGRGGRHSLTSLLSDEDELLDLDDVDYCASSSHGIKSRKKSKRRSINLKTIAKTSPPQVVVSDDEEDRESVATEVVRDDDLDSLPSISPPTPPSQDTQIEAIYDNMNDEEIEMDYDNDDGLADSFPMHHNVDELAAPILSKSSSKSSLPSDRDIDFDDLVQDAEYESLADYLAKIDKKKKSTNKVPSNSSYPASSSCTSTTDIITTSKSVPSFSSFAPTQSNSKKAKARAKISCDSDNIDQPPKSYQVNLKSNQIKSRAKKKDKENITSTSSAAVWHPPPEPTAVQQGPGRQKQPKNILKMIVLQISESVLTDELAAKLIEKELRFEIVSSPVVPDSIHFEHNVPYKMVEKDMQVNEKVHKEIDSNILIIFPVEQHLELLQGELDRADPTTSERSECLTEWVKKIQRNNSSKKITLLIQGLDAYLRKIQRATQREYRDRVLQADNPDNGKKKRKVNKSQGIKLSRYEVQNALISTQLETHMNYRFHENNSDLALLLVQYAKSVGEAPYKQEKMKTDGFDWYAVADAVGGIPVDEKGEGMRSLWLAQLEQFPKVGQESALAIARVYGSPKQLYEAYRRCSSVEEGKQLLTNIQVTMGVGPLAKTRRLGPEASKKIYRFFTSTDGEREIDG